MSETSKGLDASTEPSEAAPDYFAYYLHAVKELLSQDDDFIPFATEVTGDIVGEVRGKDDIENGRGALFSNGMRAGLSDYQRERLNVMLRQAVTTLTPEVDKMLEPVVAMQNLKSQIRRRKLFSDNRGVVSEGDAEQVPNKKLKMSQPFSSVDIAAGGSHDSEAKGTDSNHLDVASITDEVTTGQVEKEEDLQFLLKSDSSLVEETIAKYSAGLSSVLDGMVRKLEDLLDIVVSKCRSMTQPEKQQLQQLIRSLPPENLARLAETVQRNKPVAVENQHSDEVFVNLEQQDNVTLWRLYYHIAAVEKAKTLSSIRGHRQLSHNGVAFDSEKYILQDRQL